MSEALIPPLAADDYERLKTSIARDGQRIPVIIDITTGEVIDGAHRLKACGELGIEPVIEKRTLDAKEAARLRVTLNLARRQVSPEQKRELIKALRAMDFTQEEVSEIVGVSQSKVSKLEGGSNITSDNASIPDQRRSVTPAQSEEIAAKIAAGSTQAQVAADYGVSRRRAGQIAAKAKAKAERDAERKRKAEEAATRPPDERWHVEVADIATFQTDQRFDFIITDPPYAQEYIYLYGLLAQRASQLLKPGGSLLAMCGQSYLPQVFEQMTPHLTYHWTVSYLTPGGQAVQVWPRKVNAFWKPVLWFVKGEYRGKWIGDVAKSEVNDNDKRFHEWGQSESGMADLVERFTLPGDHILDPFCGAGTTGVVALVLNRRFTGIDISQANIDSARRRIVDATG